MGTPAMRWMCGDGVVGDGALCSWALRVPSYCMGMLLVQAFVWRGFGSRLRNGFEVLIFWDKAIINDIRCEVELALKTCPVIKPEIVASTCVPVVNWMYVTAMPRNGLHTMAFVPLEGTVVCDFPMSLAPHNRCPPHNCTGMGDNF